MGCSMSTAGRSHRRQAAHWGRVRTHQQGRSVTLFLHSDSGFMSRSRPLNSKPLTFGVKPAQIFGAQFRAHRWCVFCAV